MEWIGIQEGPLQLRTVLETWLELNSHCVRTWDGFVPWRYNEQATLSYFTGAIWRSGGFALQEYSTHKHKGSDTDYFFGRGDLWFELGEDEYEVEAKFCRCPLNDPFEPECLLRSTIAEAVRDLTHSRRYDDRRIKCGLAACSLVVDVRDTLAIDLLFDEAQLRGRLTRWINAVKTAGETCAWFLREDKNWPLPIHGKHPDLLFPGVAVMLQTVHAEQNV